MKDIYDVYAYGQRDNINAPVIIGSINLVVRAESIEEACQLAKDYLKPVETICPVKCKLSLTE